MAFYQYSYPYFLISRAISKKFRQNEIAPSVSFLVKDFKSRGGRKIVKNDNVLFFSITHWGIFFSETLEWMIFSLLPLILYGTSKLQVCFDALALHNILFPKYFWVCLFSIFFLLINFLGLHQPSHTLSDLSSTPSFNQFFFQWKCPPYFRRFHRSNILQMASRQASFFTELCFISLTLPLSSVKLAATYTRFIKWCLRAIPIRRSSLHQVRWNAKRLVSLMTDVKAIMS